MTFISSARSRLPTRRFSMIASGASSSSAKARARLAKPRSVTTTRSSRSLVDEVARQHVDRGQLIDRDVEEALDLALVEVHREDPVGAGDGDHVGDEAGRDRDARLVLLVGAAVGVERDDRRDPPGRRPLEGVDHDQQLHDRLVDRVRGRLDEEHVLLADVVEDLDEDVLVGELEHLGLAAAPCRDSARSCARAPGWRCRGRSRTGPRTRAPPPVGRRRWSPSRAAARGRPDRDRPSRGRHRRPCRRVSASPARNAAMAATRSPSARRMTMTPRAPDE